MYWSAISSGLKSACNNEIHSVTLSYVYIVLIIAVNGDIFAYSIMPVNDSWPKFN